LDGNAGSIPRTLLVICQWHMQELPQQFYF
jgi:hypothetical protein